MSRMMTIRKMMACLLLAGLAGSTLRAQTERESIEIDYGNPKTYVVGGVGVEGNQYFGANQVLQLTGIRNGMKLTVPGEEVTGIVKRLVAQRFFEDVAMVVDSLSAAQDTAWFKIIIKERPRVSRWTYSGVKSGERKDLQERLNLRPGREFSDYVQRTSEDIIKRYFKEKGYLLVEVDTQVQKDTMIRSAIRVNFDVKKGNKVRIKDINFKGNNEDVSGPRSSRRRNTRRTARPSWRPSTRPATATPAWCATPSTMRIPSISPSTWSSTRARNTTSAT